MDFNYSAQQHNRQYRSARQAVRRLATDVFPTLLLLGVMALFMSLVARYAESSHFTPVSNSNPDIQKFSG